MQNDLVSLYAIELIETLKSDLAQVSGKTAHQPAAAHRLMRQRLFDEQLQRAVIIDVTIFDNAAVAMSIG